jgi:hypothetical protein
VTLGLIEETFDAVNAAATESWNNISSLTEGATNYFPQISGTKWAITSGTETVTLNTLSYVRSFTIQNVCRSTSTKNITGITDTNGSTNTCTTSTGANDPSTQQLTVTVTWGSGNSLSQTEYISRWRNVTCNQNSWSAVGAGPVSCGTTLYSAQTNITTGTPLKLCPGGC